MKKFFLISNEKDPVERNNTLTLEIFNIIFVITLSSLIISSFTATGIFQSDESISIIYSKGKELLIDKRTLLFSLLFSFIDILLFYSFLFFYNPSSVKIIINSNYKNVFILSVLSIFGNLAFIMIAVFLKSLNLHISLAVFTSSLLTNTYCYLIYKMYLENYCYSNKLFYEVFRFLIVGLIAAVFDFLLCYIFQFIIFKGNENVYVTVISTIMGFLIGVVINYLLSTYMVYKKTDNKKAKNVKGMIIFLLLAVIGLLLGIGIQALFYDLLFVKKGVSFFSYPITFIFRTFVVMVYNYISRKLILYK
ncbi:MAG: GtrA family protein [Candidatus Enterosoma sp.]|nr:GtrA family protein [bacterium]MDY5865867.1 GtrA family protein [Candidatus Enterosoma sp.]